MFPFFLNWSFSHSPMPIVWTSWKDIDRKQHWHVEDSSETTLYNLSRARELPSAAGNCMVLWHWSLNAVKDKDTTADVTFLSHKPQYGRDNHGANITVCFPLLECSPVRCQKMGAGPSWSLIWYCFCASTSMLILQIHLDVLPSTLSCIGRMASHLMAALSNQNEGQYVAKKIPLGIQLEFNISIILCHRTKDSLTRILQLILFTARPHRGITVWLLWDFYVYWHCF